MSEKQPPKLDIKTLVRLEELYNITKPIYENVFPKRENISSIKNSYHILKVKERS